MPNEVANSVEYGLCECHYATITAVAEDGTPTYAEPKKLLGAVNFDVSPTGNTTSFYADNILYFATAADTGYQGDLELAILSDDFRKDIFGDTVDTNGLLVESADSVKKEFALLMQFEGDKKSRRHVLYRCTASRPNITSKTVEEQVQPQTTKVTITAMPLKSAKHITKASIDNTETNKAVYDAWFTAVKSPTFT